MTRFSAECAANMSHCPGWSLGRGGMVLHRPNPRQLLQPIRFARCGRLWLCGMIQEFRAACPRQERTPAGAWGLDIALGAGLDAVWRGIRHNRNPRIQRAQGQHQDHQKGQQGGTQTHRNSLRQGRLGHKAQTCWSGHIRACQDWPQSRGAFKKPSTASSVAVSKSLSRRASVSTSHHVHR